MDKKGFILIDKPAGISSFGVVSILRGILHVKKIGHSGTLDPFATGLLIVAVGREYTKKLDKFIKLDKVYFAKIKLGLQTDTDDFTGNIINKLPDGKIKELDFNKIKKTIKSFVGEQMQMPCNFSAKKINGKRAYKLVRFENKIPDLKSVKINIHSIEILNYNKNSAEITIKVFCSSGTYIRALARDIGNKLGVGGILTELRRVKIGNYCIDNAILLNKNSNEFDKKKYYIKDNKLVFLNL